MDELAIVGQHLSKDVIISYILVGLETDYESLIYTLIARSNTLKLEDVYSFSLTSESQLNYHKQATPIINVNANIATKQSSQTYGQGYNGGYPGQGRDNYGGNNTYSSLG